MNVAGPVEGAARPGGGSGVTAKSRLAAYSARPFPFVARGEPALGERRRLGRGGTDRR
jgi:hypothetical protein